MNEMDHGTVIIGNDVFKINIKVITSNLCDELPAINFLYVLKKNGVTYVLALLGDFTYRLYSAFPVRHFSKGVIDSLTINECLKPDCVVRFDGNSIF